MKIINHLLSLTLIASGLAFPAAQAASAPSQRTQPLRTGPENPRNRAAEASRTGAAKPEAGAADQVRVYQPGKPGEGAPKVPSK